MMILSYRSKRKYLDNRQNWRESDGDGSGGMHWICFFLVGALTLIAQKSVLIPLYGHTFNPSILAQRINLL
jgi:hypothetical protein